MSLTKMIIKGIGIISLFLFSNCYHYQVAVNKPVSTDPQEQKVNRVVWGLRQDKIIVDNCQDQFLQEVQFHTNFGHSLLNVLTLGFWKPAKVTWTCGKPKVDIGRIGVVQEKQELIVVQKQ